MVSKVRTSGEISDYVKNVTKSSSNSPWVLWTPASQAVSSFLSQRRPAGLAHYGFENALLSPKVREGLVVLKGLNTFRLCEKDWPNFLPKAPVCSGLKLQCSGHNQREA